MMAFFDFTWLRTGAWVNRCAALVQRRRMRRAEALLPARSLKKAALWRALHFARNARLQREREARDARRSARAADANDLPAPPEISKNDVLAAIARSRAQRRARLEAARENGSDE